VYLLQQMPSSASHAMAAVVIGAAMAPRPLVRPFVITGAVCAVLPDLDAIGRWWYGAAGDLQILGGHRGFTHSLTYAALCGVLSSAVAAALPRWRSARVRFGIYVALATASHGLLDALTSIGAATTPVQFFSPFDRTGYVSPWQPVHGPFSELFLLLLPLVAISRVLCHVRRIPWPRREPVRPVRLDLS
jgi:inner membrane protein